MNDPLDISVAVECSGGPEHVRVQLTDGPRAAGAAIQVKLGDQY